ncbi:zincin-like metallopeptidase domain-containing protein [Novosphingobium sp. FKTRR1]|uniref:zincin-like metallopeptidase domain-containing protein n=1 Tax=Novosphingobium sp. FKTRR1 TaxID=2879118 RepID=UPI001CF05EAB
MKQVRKNGAGIHISAGLSGYVAELSSAMLGAELGLPVAHLHSHASYIEHWLKLLKDNDRAILTAAARAEEAAGLLLKLGGRAVPGDTEDDAEPGSDAADALAA